jgi:hypothetical protein
MNSMMLVYFGIGLTKKGNFLVLYVFHTVFSI